MKNNGYWRVYLVLDVREMDAVLKQYQRIEGRSAKAAKVSTKADPNLVEMLRKAGMTIVEDKSVRPKEVWLTHEKAVQIDIFSEIKQEEI